jgi:hypothetical protein
MRMLSSNREIQQFKDKFKKRQFYGRNVGNDLTSSFARDSGHKRIESSGVNTHKINSASDLQNLST